MVPASLSQHAGRRAVNGHGPLVPLVRRFSKTFSMSADEDGDAEAVHPDLFNRSSSGWKVIEEKLHAEIGATTRYRDEIVIETGHAYEENSVRRDTFSTGTQSGDERLAPNNQIDVFRLYYL